MTVGDFRTSIERHMLVSVTRQLPDIIIDINNTMSSFNIPTELIIHSGITKTIDQTVIV